MRTIFAILVGAFCFVVAGVWATEEWDLHVANAAMATDPIRAYQLFRSLETRDLLFIRRQEVTVSAKAAAYHALPIAVREHKFATASDYCAIIAAPVPVTGYEIDAKALCRQVPTDHMSYIGALARAGEYRDALREVKVAENLYRDLSDIVEALRPLRAENQAGAAERLVAAGDPGGAFAILAAFEPRAPFPIERRASQQVAEAFSLVAARNIRDHSYPALLEAFARECDALAERPALRHRLLLAFQGVAQAAFDLPPTTVSAIRETIDFDDVPAPRLADAAHKTDVATITVSNRMSQPIVVYLRGDERDYKTPAIPSGGLLRVPVRPGRYAQAVNAGAGYVPFLGVIQVADADFTQEFVLREHGVERPGATRVSAGRRSSADSSD